MTYIQHNSPFAKQKGNRKFKRKEAKGKVDKDKMVKELESRSSKEK